MGEKMSKLVWIHKFNNNELGVSTEGGTGRGAFCLVPKDAIDIFPTLNEANLFKENVNLYVNRNFRAEVNYSKPPSKSEFRLSLPRDVHTDEYGKILIHPNAVVAFYTYEDGVNIDVNSNNLNLSDFLEEYKDRSKNNKVIEIVVDESFPGELDLPKVTRLSKPFILLAGISGTGKTRFVREQAKITGSLSQTYCLTSVRPDWHEPSDLLGYISRLSGKTEYITTDVLNFIVKAWKAIVDAELEIKFENIDGYGERFYVSGNVVQLEKIPPFWLCLDEMNLAPVEQYFADYLSILETREWKWVDTDFKYFSDPLLKASIFQQVENPVGLRQNLGLEEVKYDYIWETFFKFGLGLPFNLLVAGTVNMDETTHGFSRKVIDRALTFDFGEFFPTDYQMYFNSSIKNETLSYPIYSQVNITDLPAIDSNGGKTISFLNAINELLLNTPFKLAYRALNELLLALVSQKPGNYLELIAVWDDFLMCKVLPRIEGDIDKLMNGLSEESLLVQLGKKIRIEFKDIIEQKTGEDESGSILRPDLYRKDNSTNSPIQIECRSLDKLSWMQERLESSGFTSFWP